MCHLKSAICHFALAQADLVIIMVKSDPLPPAFLIRTFRGTLPGFEKRDQFPWRMQQHWSVMPLSPVLIDSPKIHQLRSGLILKLAAAKKKGCNLFLFCF